MTQLCTHCGSTHTHKHGDKNRPHRWKCADCEKTFTPEEFKKSDTGRPAIGDRPMTGYERLKKHIKKKSS